jgi:putative ABC transport system permease protein
MLRNYLAAALGNLARNWRYASITIAGLAVSFAAAILIGLYLRDEYSFETFIPGHQNVFRFAETLILPGEKPYVIGVVPGSAPPQLKLDFPQVERVARLEPFNTTLKKGAQSFQEPVYWADPGFFRIMQYPVFAGDPNAALEAPDGLVMTRAAARKYFGRDAPIGSTLLVKTGWLRPDMSPDESNMMSAFHPMRVMAVLQDLPSNTNIDVQVFASGRAPFSATSADERHLDQFSANALAFVELKPGASPDQIRSRLKTYADAHFPLYGGGPSNYRFRLTPLRDLHFESTSQPTPGLRPPGDRRVDAGVAAVGALIVMIAAINFVTLMTARATRRAVEVGVRKAVGAHRGDLVFQFMGEALIYVVISMVIAVALAELLLPYLNGFVQRVLKFDYLGDPRVGGTLIGAGLMTALLAGLYPSLVLSGFRPATALKGGAAQPAGSASVRNVLVVGQFAILIGLIVMTGTIYRQTNFALHDALRLDTSQVLEVWGPCRGAFRQEMERLPGVRAVSCGSPMALGVSPSKTVIFKRDRSMQTVSEGPLDVGFFEIHGLKLLAGRFFSKANGEDMVLDRPTLAPPTVQPPLVINVTAAHALGYSNPADAVGKRYAWVRWNQPTPPGRIPQQQVSEIVGVAPDFSLGSVRSPIEPTLYYVNPAVARAMLVKLDGRTMPETLRQIDAIWKRTGHDEPLERVFENQAVQDLYRDVITQGVTLAICSSLAIFIACLGLFALAAFTTERRTKEIGVRKAMGATNFDVVRLLLWQFTKPVLWANLIAWPLAFWAMDHWLHGFAYRVDLPAWLFLLAAAVAVLIAWITVAAHAWLAARAAPATALRYE